MMIKNVDIKELQHFLKEGIWRITEDEVSKVRYTIYNVIKVSLLSIRQDSKPGRCLNL